MITILTLALIFLAGIRIGEHLGLINMRAVRRNIRRRARNRRARNRRRDPFWQRTTP